MACSYCGQDGHNVQTCRSVRRCGHCHGRGHDRRNCPELRTIPPTPLTKDRCSIKALSSICSRANALLVHLYWPKRMNYYEVNWRRYREGGGWSFVATPGHGVGDPDRPTVNFLAANANFLRYYKKAAESRDLNHGVLVQRREIENIARGPGFDIVDVSVGHPLRFGMDDIREYWRFDIGQHRYRALGELQHATVVRLATPYEKGRRKVLIPHHAVEACW